MLKDGLPHFIILRLEVHIDINKLVGAACSLHPPRSISVFPTDVPATPHRYIVLAHELDMCRFDNETTRT